MIWAILAMLGVPLWLCTLGIFAIVHRNRSLRRREGNLPVRVWRQGRTRWTRGHAVWVAHVFAWRGGPAAWNEYLEPITLDVATAAEHRSARLGPFMSNVP